MSGSIGISRILYGLTNKRSVDVTKTLKHILNKGPLNLRTLDIKKILGDPFPNKPKKLMIFFNNGRHTAFTESYGKFTLPNGELQLCLRGTKDIFLVHKVVQYNQLSVQPQPQPQPQSQSQLSQPRSQSQLQRPDSSMNMPVATISIEQTQTLTKNPLVPLVEQKESIVSCHEDKLVEHGKRRVFIISNISGGGSSKYLTDITSHYTCDFIYIRNRQDLLLHKFQAEDIMFIQQLLFTDILVQDLIGIKQYSNPKIVISIHDFCWFLEGNPKNADKTTKEWPHKAYLNRLLIVDPSVKQFLTMATYVIFPSQFCFKEYSKHFDANNFVLVPHSDIQIDPLTNYLPCITKKKIKVAMMQFLSPCKGAKYVNFLKTTYKNYKGYKIEFLSIKNGIEPYALGDFYNIIKAYKIHALMHLNASAETYSYTLSYSMNTGLPIIYNNIGSFKERIPTKVQYFKVFDREEEWNKQKLMNQFTNMLDYIIVHNGKSPGIICENTMILYNDFYDKLFSH